MAAFNYRAPDILTGNGSTPGVIVDGKYQLVVTGALGGGSLQPQISLDDGVTYAPYGAPVTAPGASLIEGSGTLRFTLTGATAPNARVTLRQLR